VVNGENAADGIGITPRLADQILGMGVDAITLGNHAFRRSEIGAYLESSDRVIRPANTSRNTPGRGATVVSTASGAEDRSDQRARLPLSPPGDVDVRADRRAHRRGATRDACGAG
jgi:hypothetical protein